MQRPCSDVVACLGQIENEYGFCGFNDKAYLQHLVDTARASLGSEAILFTTDPPNVVTMGGLYGDDVISCVLNLMFPTMDGITQQNGGTTCLRCSFLSMIGKFLLLLATFLKMPTMSFLPRLCLN